MTFRRTRLTWAAKTAGSGNYGFNKKVQSDVEVALRRLQKKSVDLARFLFTKDPEVVSFLKKYVERTGDRAAKAILEGMREVGPKVDDDPIKTAGAPTRGLYGFKARTVQLALKACMELNMASGEIIHTLATRRGEGAVNLSKYLHQHRQESGDAFADLLLSSFAEVPDDLVQDEQQGEGEVSEEAIGEVGEVDEQDTAPLDGEEQDLPDAEAVTDEADATLQQETEALGGSAPEAVPGMEDTEHVEDDGVAPTEDGSDLESAYFEDMPEDDDEEAIEDIVDDDEDEEPFPDDTSDEASGSLEDGDIDGEDSDSAEEGDDTFESEDDFPDEIAPEKGEDVGSLDADPSVDGEDEDADSEDADSEDDGNELLFDEEAYDAEDGSEDDASEDAASDDEDADSEDEDADSEDFFLDDSEDEDVAADDSEDVAADDSEDEEVEDDSEDDEEGLLFADKQKKASTTPRTVREWLRWSPTFRRS
jgi:hypothetical protein